MGVRGGWSRCTIYTTVFVYTLMQFHPGIFTRVSFQRFSRKKKTITNKKTVTKFYIFHSGKRNWKCNKSFSRKKKYAGFQLGYLSRIFFPQMAKKWNFNTQKTLTKNCRLDAKFKGLITHISSGWNHGLNNDTWSESIKNWQIR